MQIVLGVEGKRAAPTGITAGITAAASLLCRLRFPHPTVDVVEVLTPLPAGEWSVDPALVLLAASETVNGERERHKAAQERVDCLATQIAGLPGEDAPLRARGLIREGNAVAQLIQHAEETGTDLIAVEGPHTGPAAAFLTGSVARALVIGVHQNLLLAKTGGRETAASKPVPKDDALGSAQTTLPDLTLPPVRAVFATDHSEYADWCVGEFLRLAPHGIEHLTVLTVYPEAELESVEDDLPPLPVGLGAAVREALAAKNDAVLRRLQPWREATGATLETRVVGGPIHNTINAAIEATMRATASDLLIVGAHGHGFWERFALGSVSFHQAMTAPYSLLILRDHQ